MSTYLFNVRINAGGIILKKHYLLPIFLAIFLCISGCAKEEKEDIKPEAIADQFLIALKANDVASIQVLSQWDKDSINVLQMKEEDFLPKIDKDLQRQVHDTLFSFDYKITDATVKDKQAFVQLSVTRKEIKPALAKGLKEAKKRLKKAYEKEKFPDADTIVFQTIYTAIANAKETQTDHITLSLTKRDQTWIVNDQNEALTSFLLQNNNELIEALK